MTTMSLRSTIEAIKNDYPGYYRRREAVKLPRKGATTDRADPGRISLVVDLPKEVQQIVDPIFKVGGSDGDGNLTRGPFVAIFHPRITQSAQQGYYLCYLFSVDFTYVYLTLALGTKQFNEGPKQENSNKRTRARMLNVGQQMADVIGGKIPDYFEDRAETDFITGKIDLGVAKSTDAKTPYEFQWSNILGLRYELNTLPREAQLTTDLNNFSRLYKALTVDPRIPAVEELVGLAVEDTSDIVPAVVKAFQKRKRAEPKNSKSERESRGRRDRAKAETAKIGAYGEQIVLDMERNNLRESGRADLADRVDWVADRGEYPGYDILSFTEDGQKIFIEVKSTVGPGQSVVQITRNEWITASNPEFGENYYLYLVSNVYKQPPVIEIIKDPFRAVNEGVLDIEPSRWELDLRD